MRAHISVAIRAKRDHMRAVCAFALLWGVASQLQLDTSGVFLAPGASAIAYDTNTVDVQVCAQVRYSLLKSSLPR